MRRRGTLHTAAAALAAALALSACQSGPSTSQTEPPPAIGGGDIDATPRASDSPSAGATEAGSDDWTPPDPITEEYLLRVLTSLEADRAAFNRWLIDSEANEQPPADARDAMARYFASGFVENAIQAKVNDHAKDPAAPGALRPYGQYRPLELELHRIDPACPFFSVLTWDESTVKAETGQERGAEVIALVRAEPGHNESGWVVRAVRKLDNVPEEDIAAEVEARTLCP